MNGLGKTRINATIAMRGLETMTDPDTPQPLGRSHVCVPSHSSGS